MGIFDRKESKRSKAEEERAMHIARIKGVVASQLPGSLSTLYAILGEEQPKS